MSCVCFFFNCPMSWPTVHIIFCESYFLFLASHPKFSKNLDADDLPCRMSSLWGNSTLCLSPHYLSLCHRIRHTKWAVISLAGQVTEWKRLLIRWSTLNVSVIKCCRSKGREGGRKRKLRITCWTFPLKSRGIQWLIRLCEGCFTAAILSFTLKVAGLSLQGQVVWGWGVAKPGGACPHIFPPSLLRRRKSAPCCCSLPVHP